MAETKKTTAKTTQKNLNIYQKLNKIRLDFLKKGVSKTGKNMYAEFKYFELEDIVPVALPILDSYDTSFLISLQNEQAVGLLINNENTEEVIEFTIPRASVLDPSKNKMNEIQSVGSETTYYRRYLYMLLLEIIEADSTDDKNPKPEVKQDKKIDFAKKVPTAKKTTDKKTKAKNTKSKESEEEPATELQIKALKDALNAWIEKDPDAKSKVVDIMKKTNKLKSVSKTQAEALIKQVSKILKEYE